MQAWEEVRARVGDAIFVPFAVQAFRAATPLLAAGVARNHPRREVLLALCVLVAVTGDLLDGHIARDLRMTGLQALSWGDLAADLASWLGGGAVLFGGVCLARDLAPERLARERRRPWVEGGLIALGVVVLVELHALVMLRTLRA